MSREKCMNFMCTRWHFWATTLDHRGCSWPSTKFQRSQIWPVPTTVKELQYFLGFANFYQKFIRGFTIIAYPLTALLKEGCKQLQWTLAAEQAFTKLQEVFTSTPILKHPDPSKSFVVEVDALETGVRAILSQQFWERPKLAPVAFFLKKLTKLWHRQQRALHC